MITITTAVREYKEMLDCEDLASSTKEKYSSTVDYLIKFMRNANKKVKYINALRHQTLTDYTDYLYAKNYTTQTIRVQLYAIKKFILFLIDMGYIEDKHIAISKTFINHIISTKKTVARKRKAINGEDFEIISRNTNDVIKKLILSIHYRYGFRISEILKLKWSDINFESNKVYIQNLKGNNSEAIVIESEIMNKIANLDKKNEWVFASYNKNDKHIHRSTISNNFKTVRESNHLSKSICLHSLRHSFTTNNVINNVQDEYIVKHTGHKSLHVLNNYVVLNVENIRDVADSNSYNSLLL